MSKFSNVAHYQDFSELLRILKENNSNYDMKKIKKAYELADASHGDQKRASGVPYILHFYTMLLRTPTLLWKLYARSLARMLPIS
jgi:(p)ppGpp synthase/HD superfamily hydrolase